MTDAEAQAQSRKAQGGKRASKAPSKVEMKRMTESMGTAEKKPKGQLGKKAKVAKQVGITKPLESKAVYDFERAAKAQGGIDVTADTKILSAPKAISAPPIEADTQVFKTLETRAKAKIAAPVKTGTAKTIAQEVAEVKSNIPMKPLEGQGAMADKPITKVVDRRGAQIERMPGGKPPAGVAERRVTIETPKAKPGKVMTTEGAVEAVKPTLKTAPVGPPKMAAGDLFGESAKPIPSALPKMQAGDLFPAKASSLAERAVSKIKGRVSGDASQVWKGAKGIVRALDPTSAYRALGPTRTSWDVAKAVGSGGLKVSKNVVKGVGTGILADYAGQMGYKLGGAINKGPGQSPDDSFNPITVGYDVGKAAMSAFGNERELARLRASGSKQGLTVTGGDSGIKAVGKGLVGALTLGRVDLGNEIKVTEAPGAQSLREKRLAQGEAKFQANKAKGPATSEFSEADYKKLKQTASRSVIKGSYRG